VGLGVRGSEGGGGVVKKNLVGGRGKDLGFALFRRP